MINKIQIIRSMEKVGIRLCSLHLADSLYCSDPAKFISVLMSTLCKLLYIYHYNIHLFTLKLF